MVAEKDTAAAAKAAIGRPKAAVGRQRAAHRLRLAGAAEICLKIAYEWLTRLHPARMRKRPVRQTAFIIVRTICI